MRLVRRLRPKAVAVTASVMAAVAFGVSQPIHAALVEGRGGPAVLVGRDDDNTANPAVQPAGVTADQSMANTDVLVARSVGNVLIGLLGSDVLQGGPGPDFLVGGTEQFTRPNSDVMFGNPGNDVSIWAPGDGSEAFLGGPGRDAEVFGVIDRGSDNVPILSNPFPPFRHGIPTAEVTKSPGFCTLERDPSLGYEFLVRFFVRSSGALAVTVRLDDVEQVFCTSQAGGAITFADLTAPDPQFVEVSRDEVERLNRLVARSIR